MNKLFAGLMIALVAVLVSLGISTPAQAAGEYDCPPTAARADAECDESPNQVQSTNVNQPEAEAANEQSSSGLLPNTGGPEGALLLGGAALLAVGGAAVVVARRRQTR